MPASRKQPVLLLPSAARLKDVTTAESLAVFASLYRLWRQTGKRAGGGGEALARRRLEHHLRLRQAFETLARARGLV